MFTSNKVELQSLNAVASLHISTSNTKHVRTLDERVLQPCIPNNNNNNNNVDRWRWISILKNDYTPIYRVGWPLEYTSDDIRYIQGVSTPLFIKFPQFSYDNSSSTPSLILLNENDLNNKCKEADSDNKKDNNVVSQNKDFIEEKKDKKEKYDERGNVLLLQEYGECIHIAYYSSNNNLIPNINSVIHTTSTITTSLLPTLQSNLLCVLYTRRLICYDMKGNQYWSIDCSKLPINSPNSENSHGTTVLSTIQNNQLSMPKKVWIP